MTEKTKPDTAVKKDQVKTAKPVEASAKKRRKLPFWLYATVVIIILIAGLAGYSWWWLKQGNSIDAVLGLDKSSPVASLQSEIDILHDRVTAVENAQKNIRQTDYKADIEQLKSRIDMFVGQGTSIADATILDSETDRAVDDSTVTENDAATPEIDVVTAIKQPEYVLPALCSAHLQLSIQNLLHKGGYNTNIVDFCIMQLTPHLNDDLQADLKAWTLESMPSHPQLSKQFHNLFTMYDVVVDQQKADAQTDQPKWQQALSSIVTVKQIDDTDQTEQGDIALLLDDAETAWLEQNYAYAIDVMRTAKKSAEEQYYIKLSDAFDSWLRKAMRLQNLQKRLQTANAQTQTLMKEALPDTQDGE